jgi:two-component system sensor histidine kinase AlgZ
MHPILSDKRKRTIYLIIWSVLGILSGFIMSAFNGLPPLYSIGFSLPMMLLYGEVNLSAWYICKAFPLDKTPLWKVLLVSAATVVSVSSAWTLIGWGVVAGIEQSFSVTMSPLPLFQSLLIIYVTGKPLFLGSLAVNYLIAAFQQTKESEHDAYEARILAQNAELKALRMQIDPHFLFNSLNSISALTSTDPQQARTMTTTLADFFRKSLSYGAKRTITLKEELSLLDDYLAIEKIRFGKRLTVEKRIDAGSLAAHVPPLLLQPLLENAIKHGIANSLDGGTIVIASQTKNDRLFITVENPMEDDAPKGKGAGMGMEIVRKRLQTIYGNDSDLRHTAAEGTFSVIIFFPIDVRS